MFGPFLFTDYAFPGSLYSIRSNFYGIVYSAYFSSLFFFFLSISFRWLSIFLEILEYFLWLNNFWNDDIIILIKVDRNTYLFFFFQSSVRNDAVIRYGEK